MDYSEFKSNNQKLFFDGMARGIIPLSQSGATLAWGDNASAPFIENLLGGPYAPESNSFDPDSGIPLGISGGYPKPWMSYSQRTNQANYTYAGPFARMIGLVTCQEGENSYLDNCSDETCTPDQITKPPFAQQAIGDGAGIWGRVGVILNGPDAGSAAFYPQNWNITASESGTRNAEFWNNHYGFTGNSQWTDRPSWWDEAEKETIVVYAPPNLVLGSPLIEVEVATAFLDFTSVKYYKGSALHSVPGFSVTMLSVMIGAAALTRWVL